MVKKKELSEIEAPFNKALHLRDKGDLDGAIDILSDLARSDQRAAVLGTLAALYRDKGDWHNAIILYQRTVALSPKSELASLGLFHSLLETNDVDQAVSEMNRFLSLSASSEYDRLLAAAGGNPEEYGRRLRRIAR